MKHKIVMVMLSVALVVGLVLVGCAKPAPVTPTPEPVTPTPAPAPEEEVFEWKFQSLYAPTAIEYRVRNQMFIDLVEEMSGGRIEITLYAGGTLCSDKEMHIACGKGQFELANSCGAYFAGTNPLGYLEFQAPGFVKTVDEFNMFFFESGFIDILEEAYNEVGVHYVQPNFVGHRSICSTVPIRTLDDLKGLKIRATGVDAKFLEALGASPTYLPTTDIYTGLALGTIDASLYGGLGKHWDNSYMEVAKYEILPDIEIASANLIINLKVWNSLPNDLKRIIETAANQADQRSRWQSELRTAEIMKQMKEKYDVEFIRLSDSDMEAIRAAGLAELRKIGEETPQCAKAIELMDEYIAYFEKVRETRI